MKNRFFSLILVVAFFVGMGNPATAYSENTDETIADIASTLECGFVDFDPADLSNNTVPDPYLDLASVDTDSQNTRAVHNPDVYIKYLLVQPVFVVFDADENFVAYYIPAGVYRSITYSANTTGLSQVGNITLTTAQTNRFYSEAVAAARADPALNGLGYMICGWRITSKFQCIADKPLYVKYRRYCNGEYSDYFQENVTSQSQLVTLVYEGLFPDLDPTARCKAGISGAFYFTYTSGPNAGTQGGGSLHASLTTNSDAK